MTGARKFLLNKLNSLWTVSRATCRPKSQCQSDLSTVIVFANRSLHQDLMHSWCRGTAAPNVCLQVFSLFPLPSSPLDQRPVHRLFDYLMKNTLDLIAGGNSFDMVKIGDLSPDKGNFHTYNHKVIYTTIKNSQGSYKYKIGIQCFPLTKVVDCNLCIEIVNVDCQLWHKSRISIDKATSKGLTIGNAAVKKFSHRYVNSSNSVDTVRPWPVRKRRK